MWWLYHPILRGSNCQGFRVWCSTVFVCDEKNESKEDNILWSNILVLLSGVLPILVPGDLPDFLDRRSDCLEHYQGTSCSGIYFVTDIEHFCRHVLHNDNAMEEASQLFDSLSSINQHSVFSEYFDECCRCDISNLSTLCCGNPNNAFSRFVRELTNLTFVKLIFDYPNYYYPSHQLATIDRVFMINHSCNLFIIHKNVLYHLDVRLFFQYVA